MAHVLPFVGISTFFLIGFVVRAVIQYVRYGQTGLIVFKDGKAAGQHLGLTTKAKILDLVGAG